MQETLFKYREMHENDTVWKFWQKKDKPSLSRTNSLLALDSAGTLNCRPEHAHILSKRNENWCFYLITQGKGSFRLHGNSQFFSPGDMIVVAPQFVNITFNISTPFLELKNFSIENSVGVQNLCLRDVPDAALFHPADFRKLLTLHGRLISAIEQQTDERNTEISILLPVFSFLYEIEHQCFEMEYSDPVKMIYSEINNFPDKVYSIQELAKKSGFNVRTLQRKFKKQIGCSIQNLITTCRIGLARKLLQNSFLPIAEIASQCYYKNVSFFSKTFKEKTGISPNEFRKRNTSEKRFTDTSNLTSGIKSDGYSSIKKLSPRKKQLLWLINEQRNISIQELAKKMNINASAVQKHIESLKREKVLRRSGPRRGGRWIISHP